MIELYGHATGEFLDNGIDLPRLDRGASARIDIPRLGLPFLGVGEDDCHAEVDDLAKGHARLDATLGKAEDFAVTPVGQQKSLLLVEQAKPLRHVLQRQIEVLRHLGQTIGVRLLLRDVLGDVGIADKGTARVMDRVHHRVSPETGSILAVAPALGLELSLLASNAHGALRLVRRTIFRAIKAREVLADDLCGRETHLAFGALVPVRHPALCVEHVDGIILHALQKHGEAACVLVRGHLGLAGKDGSCQPRDEQREGNGRDEGHHDACRQHRLAAHRHRTRFDAHGGHGGEMQRHDGERHQAGGKRAIPRTRCGAQAADQPQRAEEGGAHDRSRDIGLVEEKRARQFHRRHADIVHGGYAGSKQQATRQNRTAARDIGRHAEPRGGDEYGDAQRNKRRLHEEAHIHAGIVGQHGDEVSCPDAETAGSAGRTEPENPCHSTANEGALREDNRGITGQKADECGEQDETKVVLNGQAGQDIQHEDGYRVGLCDRQKRRQS